MANIKILKRLRAKGDKCSKLAREHYDALIDFENELESLGVDVYELTQSGGDEFAYIDSVAYGQAHVRWDDLEKALNNGEYIIKK